MVQPTFLINSTDIVGVYLAAFTNNITGDIVATLYIHAVLFIALFLAAGIPIEWTMIFILPLTIYVAAYSTEFLKLGGFVLIYLGIMLAKNWFANR